MNSTRLLILRNESMQAQFCRYFLVGGGAFVIDFALLYLLTEFGRLQYLISASLSFLAGTVVNYSLSVRWVFDHRSVDNRIHEFVIFAVIGILGLVLNAALIWFFTELAELHYLGSKMIAAASILVFNFGVRKALLFSSVTGDKRAAPEPSNA